MRKCYIVPVIFLIMQTLGFAKGQEETVNLPRKILTVRYATIMAPGDPIADAGEKFATLVKEKSSGSINVETYPGGSLGSERENLEALRTGVLEVAGVSALADTIYFAPEYGVFSSPYLIKNREHLNRVWDSEVGQEINSYVEKTLGIKTLTIMYRGARHLTSNKSIEKVEDVKGLKMRVPDNQVYLEVWKALGANPIPVAFPELYGALQTGVVSAQENPLATIYSSKFYEVQKYLILTGHIIEAYKFQCSKKWFEGLTSEQQKIILTCVNEATEYGNRLAQESENSLKAKLVELGMTIVEPDISSFRERAMPKVLELGRTYFKPGLVEKVIKLAE